MKYRITKSTPKHNKLKISPKNPAFILILNWFLSWSKIVENILLVSIFCLKSVMLPMCYLIVYFLENIGNIIYLPCFVFNNTIIFLYIHYYVYAFRLCFYVLILFYLKRTEEKLYLYKLSLLIVINLFFLLLSGV